MSLSLIGISYHLILYQTTNVASVGSTILVIFSFSLIHRPLLFDLVMNLLHAELLSKPSFFGIYYSICGFVHEFLSCRPVQAVLFGHLSSFKFSNREVSYGLLLFRTLFLFFILSQSLHYLSISVPTTPLHYSFHFQWLHSKQKIPLTRRVALDQLLSSLSRISNLHKENMVIFNTYKT